MAQMKSKTIYCVHCHAEIETRDDLVVSLSFMSLLAYHNACYASALKGCQSFVISDEPINGTASNWLTAVSILLSLVSFICINGYVGAIFLLVPSIRFCSWFMYERHLN
ncbi:hypothetical protein [Paenibacillus sp. 453mf]|uniref:hypothetical protein n=1 Tax=Paenibacillus sp. 453mf TaxID=1761874 RepID=UPI0008E84F9E|nr:hypothetical protein [Paenibacillus sp. 453mf]SFS57434.1 hypothetical protein SAMN04488601_1011924 [Paenibacillus sp. 453mf]